LLLVVTMDCLCRHTRENTQCAIQGVNASNEKVWRHANRDRYALEILF